MKKNQINNQLNNLRYIQKKTNVSNILWGWGNGLALTHCSVKEIFKGLDFGNTVWVCQRNNISVAGDKTTKIDIFNKHFKQEIIKDPQHVKKIKEIFEKKIKITKKLIINLKTVNLNNKSNRQLLTLYKKIVDSYIQVYPYGEPISFACQNFADWVEKKFIGAKEEFGVLINPLQKSFLQNEQQDLLKIAISAKRKSLNLKKIIEEHADKYTWIPYDYGANFYNQKYFNGELKKLLKKDIGELINEYGSFKNYSSKLKNQQEKIFKKYKISEKNIKYFKILQDCYYLLDYKKEIFTQLHWCSRQLFKEIGKRLKLNSQQVQYVLPSEMKNFLLGKINPDNNILKDRYNGFILIIRPNGEVETLEGNEAKKIADNYYQIKASTYKEIKGSTAQRGIINGIARVIVDAKKCSQLKKGEVLVTVMTSPDFMVAVKKASAIITDEGGIICHAAIVSRELKIPCIVGTKIATKAIKTGSRLEVNANHGFIKILN